MQGEKPKPSSSSTEEKYMAQKLQREERQQEEDRIRAVVTQRAGMVGASSGSRPAMAGVYGTYTAKQAQEAAMADPRAVKYRAQLERHQKEQREMEEDRIRQLCEQKAAQYGNYGQIKQDTEPQARGKHSKDKHGSKRYSKSNPSKTGGNRDELGPSKVKRERRENNEEGKGDGIELEQGSSLKNIDELLSANKVVHAAPMVGQWEPVRRNVKEEMEKAAAVLIDDLPEQAKQDEADVFEELSVDPKEHAFQEKSIAAGSLASGSGKKVKTIQFKKRKAGAANIRQRGEMD